MLVKPLSTRKAVLQFFGMAQKTTKQFTKQELVDYVNLYRRGTPASTVERAVRELRTQGLIDYTLRGAAYEAFPPSLTLNIPSQLDSVADATGDSSVSL